MLEARNLSYSYGAVGRPVVDDVSISIVPSGVTGLTGPSGGGKSTLARLLCGHLSPDKGTIIIDGANRPSQGLNAVQLLSQTPIFAVNQRWTIGRIISEAWTPEQSVRHALGVKQQWYDRFPHELSGGELQRVSILRSLAPGVRYLIADEITAMLDPITQAEIWNFLRPFATARNIGILAISHDRALLAKIADTVLEMG